MAGAERRGWAIIRRIGEILDGQGLETDPDFRSAWIDGLVTIRLKVEQVSGESRLSEMSNSDLEASRPDDGPDPFEDGDPSSEIRVADKDCSAPMEENLNSPDGNAGVIEIPVATPVEPANASAPGDPVRRISSIASANRGVRSVLLTDSLQTATTLMIFSGYSQLAIMQGEREVRGDHQLGVHCQTLNADPGAEACGGLPC